MIESYAYEIIKEEGLKEGFIKGKEEGLKEGILKGKEEGERKGLLEGIEALLELKFGFEGFKIFPKVAEISHLPTLKALKEVIKSAKNLSEVEKFLEEVVKIQSV